MKTKINAIIALLALLCCYTYAEDPDTLVSGGYSQREMDQAIKRANSELPSFLEELEKADADTYSIKTPITDGDDVEHFWIVDIKYKDGVFSGKVGNDPGIVGNVKFGDHITVNEDEISDWMYMKNGKIYGGYTIDPLLATMSKEEADSYRQILVR